MIPNREHLDGRMSPKAVTHPPMFHFFGYYGICPWDRWDRRLLALEVEFQDRPPTPQDRARILLIDLEEDLVRKVATTSAWNFQQGCMMHWLPQGRGTRFIHNDRSEGGFISRIVDVETGESYAMPLPVSAVSSDGRYALSLNFSRIHKWRPGYGYPGVEDPHAGEMHPDQDGVFVMDLRSGEKWLAVSMEQVALQSSSMDVRDKFLWFNHTLFNPSASRFVFLSRFAWNASRLTAMFTSDLSGGDLYRVIDYGLVSHFDWRNDGEILVWADLEGQGGAFYLVRDKVGIHEKVAEGLLTSDGHCSFSPDRRWILSDTYPLDGYRHLMLYSETQNRIVDLGRYYSLPQLSGEIRCDLHPRWNRRGNWICFDSTHEGSRQMYLMDLSPVLG